MRRSISHYVGSACGASIEPFSAEWPDPLSAIDFLQLSDALDEAGSSTGAAQCHATLSGLICAGPALPPDWMTHATGGGDSAGACAEALTRLERQVRSSLSGGQMNFDLLLPGDDAELEQRARSLALWCHGFVYGLTVGGIQVNRPLPGEVSEVIRDFCTLSEASHEGEAAEEDEVAYVELCEFVRVGAQLVFEELLATRRDPR